MPASTTSHACLPAHACVPLRPLRQAGVYSKAGVGYRLNRQACAARQAWDVVETGMRVQQGRRGMWWRQASEASLQAKPLTTGVHTAFCETFHAPRPHLVPPLYDV
eukprot:353493-Chlamydomonas_euryale.AAC.3